MNSLFFIGKKEIGWLIVLLVFFTITLKLGIWYGSQKSALETKTVVVQTATENVVLRDKVAALEVSATIQEQKLLALIDQMTLVDKCMKRKWRGC